MNQPSRTIYNSSSAHLFNGLNQLIWFMNQVQRINYRIEFRTIVELVRFIASPTRHPLYCSIFSLTGFCKRSNTTSYCSSMAFRR